MPNQNDVAQNACGELQSLHRETNTRREIVDEIFIARFNTVVDTLAKARLITDTNKIVDSDFSTSARIHQRGETESTLVGGPSRKVLTLVTFQAKIETVMGQIGCRTPE